MAIAALLAGSTIMMAQTTPRTPPPSDPSSPTTTTPRASGELKHSDKSFIEKVAKGGQKEVQLAQIAAERATNPQVKEYAQMLVTDHQQMNNEVMTLAANKGVQLPVESPKLDKWSNKKANEFDKDFIKEMVDEHEDDISLFEKAAKSEDAEVAAFAQKYLPKLQSHYTQAKDLKKTY
ncbi:MAG TPA: DUF4142 domain-containing protein [Candidatus Didemnitutus sp.]|nr:DUF4142 domain-containing protein [Candidatus Didemnitutus sp.]